MKSQPGLNAAILSGNVKASPVGIKSTVNTHEAQSAPAETYGSHLSHSTARQIVFPPLQTPQQEQEERGKEEMSHPKKEGGGWGGDAEWDAIMWRLISFILVHAAGAQKVQRQLFKYTKC